MARKAFVVASERIAYGSRVLLRGARVSAAEPALANGTAIRPNWLPNKGGHYLPGETVQVEIDEGLGARNLHALANGPIMDPSQIYLPAGKLSMAETIARERQQILPAHDERTDDEPDR